MILIVAKLGVDPMYIYKVTSCKTKWSSFFGPPCSLSTTAHVRQFT